LTDSDGGIISTWVLKKALGEVDWIHLAEVMDHWLAVVNTIINLQVLKRRGIS
jgi:hypothetical protein